MSNVNFILNGKPASAESGMTILDAARAAGVDLIGWRDLAAG